MTFSQSPFSVANEETFDLEKLADQILNTTFVTFPTSHNRSIQLLNMIRLLLNIDPKARPSTEQILATDVVRRINTRKVKFFFVKIKC